MKKVFILWLSCIMGTYGQNYQQFSGKVLDLTSHEPINGANIRIGTIGTSSNEKGDFLLKVPTKFIGSLLTVSMIGYRNYTQMLSASDTVLKAIHLESSNVTLDEVKVYSSALGIVISAIEHIEANYFTKPTLLKGFYREMAEDTVKKQYHYLAEAVEEIYKPPYTSSSEGNVYIIQARKKEFLPLDSMTTNFSGGAFLPLTFDAIHEKCAFINLKNLDDYTYKLLDITEFDNQDVYVITFYPKSEEKVGWSGKLYINTKNESIIGIDYNYNKKFLDKLSRNAPNGTTFFKKASKIRYQNIAHKYFLQSVSHEMVLEKMGRKKKLGNYKLMLEYTTTDVDSVNTEKNKEVRKAHRSDVFVKVVGALDKDFWGNYTTVLQNSTLEDQLNKLSKNTFEK